MSSFTRQNASRTCRTRWTCQSYRRSDTLSLDLTSPTSPGRWACTAICKKWAASTRSPCVTASPPGVRQVLAVRVAFVDHARSSPKNALLICWLEERAAWLHPEQGGSSSWTLLALTSPGQKKFHTSAMFCKTARQTQVPCVEWGRCVDPSMEEGRAQAGARQAIPLAECMAGQGRLRHDVLQLRKICSVSFVSPETCHAALMLYIA